ncbi:ABC transporter permease [Maridesulfovibrio sp.]|jgi:peptide/nickel transport system permease protein|uniref:ABC transporter permease n=1 Tax=Maridesulfovibrio sp. TaxID=2795000 RepID=UPI0029CA18AE|nr:ABC transporter permease [Maridesulfovibrio sp.]
MKKIHKDFWLRVFLIIALFLIVGSLFAKHFAPNDPYSTHIMSMRQAPGMEYPMGTDAMGRCVLSRLLYGARTSVFSALSLVFITAVFGAFVGILCGYYSGSADRIVMRFIDGIMAFPQMVLAISVAGILGGGMGNAMLAMGFASWTPYARLARSRVISLKNEEFIQAARISGCSDSVIMIKYILPNIFNSLLTFATSQIGTVMLGFAGLSFLGLGVQLPQAEWGSMISESRGMLRTAPWTVMYPAAALVITVMVFNYLGDALRDRIDVKDLGEDRV